MSRLYKYIIREADYFLVWNNALTNNEKRNIKKSCRYDNFDINTRKTIRELFTKDQWTERVFIAEEYEKMKRG